MFSAKNLPKNWRTLAGAAALVVAASTPVLAVTTSSAAAAADVEFSSDGGATWSSTPPVSLFDQSFRAVPGDRLEAALMVRSTRSAPTVAMVAITNTATSDALFDSALTVRGQDGRGRGLAPVTLGALGPCDPLVPTRVLTRGEALPVTLVVDVSPTLTRNQAAEAVAAFDLAIALTDPGAPTTPNGCAIDPIVVAGFVPAAGGTIAYTGTDLVYPTLAVGAAVFGLGWALVAVSRRRRAKADAS
jgi:hypothetical protein